MYNKIPNDFKYLHYFIFCCVMDWPENFQNPVRPVTGNTRKFPLWAIFSNRTGSI